MGKIIRELKTFKKYGKKIKTNGNLIKLFIGISVLFFLFTFWSSLKITRIEYYSEDIPDSFDGYRIVQITDLHCANFGKNQNELIQAIKGENPDLIVITGDMYDKKQWNYDNLKCLLSGIEELAPIYAVTGNNEYDDSNMYDMLKMLYEEYGVHLLNDEVAIITRGDEHICIYGMYYRYYVKEQFFELTGERNQFNILLYHDPNQFQKLKRNGFDLVLSGHTHGGIIRLPIIGGIIDNNFMLFPEYDYGMFHAEECDMFVSSGLGKTSLPRINNRPELVTIILKTSK